MKPAEPEDLAQAQGLQKCLGLSFVPVGQWIHGGPVAFGWIRPAIALPADFHRRFDARQREAILAHELAHLAARDPWWLALADALAALVWWHPLVWWMRRRFRASCEAAADEASALVPSGPAALAESLLILGRHRIPLALGVSGAGYQSEMGQRIEALLEDRPDWKKLSGAWLWTPRLLAFASALLAGAIPLQAAHPALMFASMAAKNPALSHGPSIRLQVEFVEAPDFSDSGLDTLFAGPWQIDAESQSEQPCEFFPALDRRWLQNVTLERSENDGKYNVIDEPRFRVLRRKLTALGGVSLLSFQSAILTSGHQARVSSKDIRSIVFDAQVTNHTVNYQVARVDLGPDANIILQRDGNQWRVQTLATYLEFNGYGSCQPRPYTSGSPPQRLTYTLPLPRFRVRQSKVEATAKAGQTIIVRGGKASAPRRFYVCLTLSEP